MMRATDHRESSQRNAEIDEFVSDFVQEKVDIGEAIPKTKVVMVDLGDFVAIVRLFGEDLFVDLRTSLIG